MPTTRFGDLPSSIWDYANNIFQPGKSVADIPLATKAANGAPISSFAPPAPPPPSAQQMYVNDPAGLSQMQSLQASAKLDGSQAVAQPSFAAPTLVKNDPRGIVASPLSPSAQAIAPSIDDVRLPSWATAQPIANATPGSSADRSNQLLDYQQSHMRALDKLMGTDSFAPISQAAINAGRGALAQTPPPPGPSPSQNAQLPFQFNGNLNPLAPPNGQQPPRGLASYIRDGGLTLGGL